MDKSHLQMNSQFVGTVTHGLLTYLFVSKMQMDIRGTALASILTNLQILLANKWLMEAEPDLAEALEVRFFDKKVPENLGTYMSIALPNMTIILLDWTCFQCSALMVGLIGINEQAFYFILINIG